MKLENISFLDIVNYVKDMIKKYPQLKDYILEKNDFQIYIIDKNKNDIIFQKNIININDKGNVYYFEDNNNFKKDISFNEMFLIIEKKLKELLKNP